MLTQRQKDTIKGRIETLEREAAPLLGLDNPSRDEIMLARGCAVELLEAARQFGLQPPTFDEFPAIERLAKLTDWLKTGHEPIGSRSHDGGNAEPWRPPGAYMPGEGRRLTYAGLFGDPRSDHRSYQAGAAFKSLGDFVRAATGGNDGTIEARGLKELTDGDGGFHVAPQYASMLLDQALESSVVMPRAQVLPMDSSKLVIPGFHGPDHSAGVLYGGFTASWLAETSEGSVQTPVSIALALRARKLALFSKASDEILEDVTGIERLLGDAMRDALGFTLDDAFIWGDGAGKPMGIMNAPSKVTVAKESGQAAGSILPENVIKMWARLHPALHRNAVWLAHPSTLPELMTLGLAIGTGGSLIYAVTPAPDGSYKMLSRPLVLSEKLEQVGTVGDLVLCDLSQYMIGMRRQLSIARSNAPGFMTSEQYFRITTRVDGQPRWKTAVTPRRGADTLSWAVDLATRA